jgi:hypothetical protein
MAAAQELCQGKSPPGIWRGSAGSNTLNVMNVRDELQAALGTVYTLGRELGGGGMSRVFVGA